MSRFRLIEFLFCPLILVVCVGCVVGIDCLPIQFESYAINWTQFALDVSQNFSWGDMYVFHFLNNAAESIIIAVLCGLLGLLYLRESQILAGCTIVAMPLATLLMNYYMRSITSGYSATVAVQIVFAELTAFAICCAAWFLGYRSAARKYEHVEQSGQYTRRIIISLVFLLMLVASHFGWGVLSMMRETFSNAQ